MAKETRLMDQEWPQSPLFLILAGGDRKRRGCELIGYEE